MTPAEMAAVSTVEMMRITCAVVLAFLIMEIITHEPDDPDGFA